MNAPSMDMYMASIHQRVMWIPNVQVGFVSGKGHQKSPCEGGFFTCSPFIFSPPLGVASMVSLCHRPFYAQMWGSPRTDAVPTQQHEVFCQWHMAVVTPSESGITLGRMVGSWGDKYEILAF